MGRKLLVADDSVTIQKVIKLALSSEGYDILAVSDGKEAIRAIQEEQPDVVLIDVTLPGADAYAVKRAINANPKLASIGFILMLSAFERVDEKAIEETKFQGRLIKPFDPSHLRKAVADILSGKTTDIPAGLLGGATIETPPPPPAAPELNSSDAGLSIVPPAAPSGENTGSQELSDLPPVQDMHPTVPDEPAQPMTEEEFQIDSPIEVTRTSLSLEALKPATEAAGETSAEPLAELPAETLAQPTELPAPESVTPPVPTVDGSAPEAPPPAPVQPSAMIATPADRTDPNFTLPDEAVTRSLENDIKDLTESTIKMSGLDEWNLDDSRKMKSPDGQVPSPPAAPGSPGRQTPPAVPPPLGYHPSMEERTREMTQPTIDKKAAVLRGLMSAPAKPFDDGGSTFPLKNPPSGQTQQKSKTAPPVSGQASPLQPQKPVTPAAISQDIGLGRDYVGPSKTPVDATQLSSPTEHHAELKITPTPVPGAGATATPALSRAEIEQMIRKDFEATLEKMLRDEFPRLAEQIIRQEIEKLLNEP